ncbi:hypothetical protein KIL84_012079 [Mauremys mutica]|uniref:Uncharacterized protein n=1 Tax=Mauremys mutica TaxID=74926 RepID=A0A9D4AVY4_9SAUR|nr:hypothetical protein KIL84_012079 [Mauremys mutica]
MGCGCYELPDQGRRAALPDKQPPAEPGRMEAPGRDSRAGRELPREPPAHTVSLCLQLQEKLQQVGWEGREDEGPEENVVSKRQTYELHQQQNILSVQIHKPQYLLDLAESVRRGEVYCPKAIMHFVGSFKKRKNTQLLEQFL